MTVLISMRFSPSNNNYGNAGTKLGVSRPSLVSKTIGENGVVSNAERRLTVLVILTLTLCSSVKFSCVHVKPEEFQHALLVQLHVDKAMS